MMHIFARTLAMVLLTLTAGVIFAGRAQAAEDDLPNPFSQVPFDASPKNLIIETPGVQWFTFPDADKVARVTLTSGQTRAATTTPTIEYFPTGAGSRPYDLVFDNGALWITLFGTNKIGRLNPVSGVLQTYPVPTANSEPTGITAGGGFIWFVERKGDNLGKLDPTSGSITEYTDQNPNDDNIVDMSDAELEDVAYSSAGPWFTGPSFKTSVALYKLATGKFIGSPAGGGAQPMQIWVDPATGDIWITAKGINRLGHFGLNTLGLWDYFELPAPPVGVDLATSGPVGLFVIERSGQYDIWYTRPGVNRIGRQITAADGTRIGQTESILPVANGAPWGIVADADGNVWAAATGTNQLVEWSAPYFAAFLYLAFATK